MKAEQLFFPSEVEVREDGGTRFIEGRGAVYYRKGEPGTEFRLWQDVYERILPGAFDEALESDVRSLFNHDPNIVLGRTKSGTLALTVDKRGLRYSVTAPDTALVRDQVLGPIQRKDVTGSSFMFLPREAAWVQEERDGKTIEIRELRKVDVMEVGPVTFPAYEATTTGVRAMGDLAEIRSSWETWKRSTPNESEAIAIAVRMAEVHELESNKNY